MRAKEVDCKDGIRRVRIKCPGCGESHVMPLAGSPSWGFNEDFERPTFTPSILVRCGHYAPHYKPGDNCWCTYNVENKESPAPFECGICHSFVANGKIQFLNDCTHELAGQTVDLPEIE